MSNNSKVIGDNYREYEQMKEASKPTSLDQRYYSYRLSPTGFYMSKFK